MSLLAEVPSAGPWLRRAAVPVAKYGMDKGGEGEDVKERVEEVCQRRSNCLSSMKNGFWMDAQPVEKLS
mgnify:CR=1 FL=1